MKLLLLSLLASLNVYAAENCSVETKEESQEVVYEVNKPNIPSHLKGAKITVTLADGKSTTVPAEQFMVVPRKQKTVVGANKTITKSMTCNASGDEKKNIVMLEARNDVTDLSSTTTATATGTNTRVKADKGVVGGVNLYRKEVAEILDHKVGAGLGLDSNGTVKGMIGIDF